MAAPDLTLQKPLVLIQQSGSVLGITMTATPLIFGTVVLVYGTCDTWAVNDSVLFDPTKGSTLRYSDVDYYLIDELYIYSKEGIPL